MSVSPKTIDVLKRLNEKCSRIVSFTPDSWFTGLVGYLPMRQLLPDERKKEIPWPTCKL